MNLRTTGSARADGAGAIVSPEVVEAAAAGIMAAIAMNFVRVELGRLMEEAKPPAFPKTG